MIAACHATGCHNTTGLPDDGWLTIRPLVWSAFTEELTFCSPRCAAAWLTETYAPPKGLLP